MLFRSCSSDLLFRSRLLANARRSAALLRLAVLLHRAHESDEPPVLDLRADGDRLRPGDVALAVRAPLTTLLTAERTALNLLCQLSGVATATSAWVDAVAGTPARIRDTRKTVPGLRALQKYAVRCGGGVNHRMSLGDALLIKDNHVHVAGSVTAAVRAARAAAPELP